MNYYDQLEELSKELTSNEIAKLQIDFAMNVIEDFHYSDRLTVEYNDYGYIESSENKYIEHEDFIPFIKGYLETRETVRKGAHT